MPRVDSTLGWALIVILASSASPSTLGAQTWSTFHASRLVEGEAEIGVEVRYSAGTFHVGTAEPGLLYRMGLEYDEEAFQPLSEYQNGQLVLGVEGRNGGSRFRGRDARGELDLRLSRDVPVDLHLEFGAVRADMDLGGLRLRELDLSTGASDAKLRVSEPNPVPLSTVRIRVGAASFEARELGNLNAERFDIEAGVGDVRLDFDGAWSRDARAEVQMGIGALELRVPPDIGIRLSRSTFLTSVDTEGLERRGDDFYSTNWETAERRLELHVSATLGRVRIIRAP